MAESVVTGNKLMIVDTDCGTDDALAILLALNYHKEWKIIAFTCCFGNTSVDNACKNVMRVLYHTNRTQIPIYQGCSEALVHPSPDKGTAHGGDGFGNVSAQFPTGGLSVSEGHAANMLVKLAKENPKQITLVALGPLTNLAMAHRMDPEFTQNLKAIMLMGGSLEGRGNITGSAEFNFYSDPESANIILTEASCPIRMVPLEPGKKSAMQKEWYEKWIQAKTKRGNLVKSITTFRYNRAIQSGISVIVDYDVLAMAALLCPNVVVKSCSCPVSVELKDSDKRGQTIIGKTANAHLKEKKRIVILMEFDDTLLKQLREKIMED